MVLLLLVLSLAGTMAASGNELPMPLVFIHDNELRVSRPAAADSIIIGDRSWAQPMTPLFTDGSGDTVLFTAHPVIRFGERDFVNIEIANLYLSTPSGVRQLTDYDGFTVAPDYSPDGRRIIFVYKNRPLSSRRSDHPRRLFEKERSMQLYVQEDCWDTGRGQVRSLTQTAGDKFNPQWSPDGRRVAFAWLEGESFGIHVLEVASGRTIEVALGGNYPTWRPDGGAIAFSRNGQVFSVEVDEKGAIALPQPLLPDFRGYCSFLRWTSSGLLFQWARAREQGISLLTPENNQVRVLVSGAGEYGGADLASPSGDAAPRPDNTSMWANTR